MAQLAPLPHESQPEFAVRAHQALAATYPETSHRNEVVLRLWRHATQGRDRLTQKAVRAFPPEKFERVPDVCVFCEHDTENQAGEPQHYDAQAMMAICQRMNARVSDTSTFAKITKGHTPGPDEVAAGMPQPEVLGYQGPFYLGMIGDDNPKYAIFADEWWRKDKAHMRQDLPGRSVEIWQLPEITERFFDPVAALGAECPRLDMPMKFSIAQTGIEIAKYQAVMPGAGNAYVPSDQTIKPHSKERYDMLSPEEITSLAQAIAAAMKGANAAPEAPEAPVAPVDDLDNDQMGLDELPPEGDDPPADDYRYDLEPACDMAAEEEEPEAFPAGKFSRAHASEVARYRRENEDLRIQLARHKRDSERISRLEREKTAAERYARLQALAADGYVFRPETKQVNGKQVTIQGIDREMERCRGMNDAQFANHLVVIAENYQRQERQARQGFYVPAGDVDPPNSGSQNGSPEQSAEVAREARTRYELARQKGEKTSYAMVLQAVAKERGLSIR